MNWHEGLRRIKLAGYRLMLSSIAGGVLWFLMLIALRVDLFGLFFMVGVPLTIGAFFLLVAWILEGFLGLPATSNDRP
jgi:hypothetical protein